MFSKFKSASPVGYLPLSTTVCTHSDVPPKVTTRYHATFRRLTLAICVITFYIGSLFAAFILGSYRVGDSFSTEIQNDIQMDTTLKVFRYNHTFGEAPSVRSDSAWNELFPEQGGFFKHPTLAPQRSAFSVFHQLHCLNSIRKGYWALHDAAEAGKRLQEDTPMMSSPPHIRHCIDLLRNSLMCQPDMTIELKDEATGGVRGFGTVHQCKDWRQLLRWVAEWQIYGQKKGDSVGGG